MFPTRTIAVLPQSVIEKIAAGEVVERPAAVVKELVENSIDAGATEIKITIEDAGFSIIKVIDNGSGMSPDNLKKCLLPHSTSKIKAADDLFAIGTFGFRGEALSSIGAISNLSVASAIENNGSGFEILCNGGAISNKPIPLSHPRGTSIAVSNLFYNVPARKKFMKSRRGEHLAIIRMLEQLVIPFPAIHFVLQMDGKNVFDLPTVEQLPERIGGVAGFKFASSLIECRNERENMELLVYVSPPTPETTTDRPRFQCLYVNLRRINNDSVQYSVREAFSHFLGHHHRPSFFCFLSIDPAKVDVNVHPTKQQIKFDNEKEIFGYVFNTVKNGIDNAMVKKEMLYDDSISPNNFYQTAATSLPNITKLSETNKIFDLYTTNGPPAEKEPGKKNYPGSNFPDSDSTSVHAQNQTILQFPGISKTEKDIDPQRENTIQLSNDYQEKMWDLIPCYQIHSTFILAPIKNGILLIDQHAAHERILFEQALKKDGSIRTTSQQLLFPIVIELTPAEKAVVVSGNEYFERFGFEITDFGGNTVSVSAIPAFIKNSLIEKTIRAMIKYLLDGKITEEIHEPDKRFASAFACGAAIKAGDKLSQEEMNALLNNLFATDNPYICPHGRPTLVRMSLDELYRRFLR